MTDVSSHLTELQHRLPALSNSFQRAKKFADYISSVDSEPAAQLFSAICCAPLQTRHPAALLVAEATFASLLHYLWPPEHLRHTREAAAAHENRITEAFLHFPASPDTATEDGRVPTYFASDRTVTLGERKSLAARPARRFIEQAMMDPHPDVVQKLLTNPKLTETDVVRMCAGVSMSPSVLCEIAAHAGWRKQPHVRKALVNNRRLPAAFSLTLIPFLPEPVLQEISIDQRLDERVREAARLLLESPVE